MPITFDIKGVLKDIVEKAKVEKKEVVTAAYRNVYDDDIRFTEDDRTNPKHLVGLTKFEVYYLMTHIRTHLRIYHEFEWSELKDVLTTVLKTLDKEWELCQSTVVSSVKENSLSGKEVPADSVSTTSGS